VCGDRIASDIVVRLDAVQTAQLFFFHFRRKKCKKSNVFFKTPLTNNCLHVGCTTWSNLAESLVYRMPWSREKE
jgi:hypothetical protein